MSNVQKDEEIVRQCEHDTEVVEDVDETLNERQKVNHKKSQSYRSAVEAGFEFTTLHLSKDEGELSSNKCSDTTSKKKKNRSASFLNIFTKKFPETEKTQSKMGTKVRRYKTFNIGHTGSLSEERVEHGEEWMGRKFSASASELNKSTGQRKMSNFGSFWSRREGRRQRAAERIGNFLKIRKENLEKLIRRGIFRPHRVFGSTIPDIVKADGTEVPVFLSTVLSLICSPPANLRNGGLYRQNGNQATIQTLRYNIENGDMSKLDTAKNVHILTGLVKLFFRELKDPLISGATLKELMLVLQDTDKTVQEEEVMVKVNNIISRMPKANRLTLYAVLDHLSSVAAHSDENNMTAENLAIVMGPNLTWSQAEAMMDNITTMMARQNNVVAYLISNYHKLQMLSQEIN